MLVGVFQLLEAKRGQIEAGEKYIEALHDYWEARTDLEAALGRAIPVPEGNAVRPSDPVPAPAAPHTHHH